MLTTIDYNSRQYKIDLSKPLDISIPLRACEDNVNAWYLGPPRIEPVKSDGWIGSVKQGGSVNFNNIYFNPHAHGTHTECVGHIIESAESINQQLKRFFFFSQLISIEPKSVNGDKVINRDQIDGFQIDDGVKAFVIRTLPNSKEKISRQYSHKNPAYLSEEAMEYLVELGIEHLLIDLPSVDREKDDGKLLAHKVFWQTSGDIRYQATITELIYVNETIPDGLYFLNLQIASFENDATPSKPVLYKLID